MTDIITSTLIEREKRIERLARRFWFDTALEYKVIRDSREYKQAGWNTWSEYCSERWSRTSQHVDNQIARAREVQEIEEISSISNDQIPTSMSHATALSKLEKPEHRAQVWQNVIGNANGRGITAKTVDDEVSKFKEAMNKKYITLTEWNNGERWHGPQQATTQMNTTNDNIEWAAYSWNPVTGCLHNCNYCYARDIAARFYPQNFEPSFLPERLSQPSNTNKMKPRWNGDSGNNNVFTCSMADLFGKWVPDEWITSVLDTIENNPQFNFLLLTKFPIRMAEFDYPSNVWLGTSVDKQHAVKRAETAFIKIKQSGFDGVCWLSCEPMLERLTFSNLNMFDWVVYGGSSKSTQTPEYRPPFDDIVHLYNQAIESDCLIYQKTNLIPGMSDEQRLRNFPAT